MKMIKRTRLGWGLLEQQGLGWNCRLEKQCAGIPLGSPAGRMCHVIKYEAQKADFSNAHKEVPVTIRQAGQTLGRALERRPRRPDETIVTLAPQQVFK